MVRNIGVGLISLSIVLFGIGAFLDFNYGKNSLTGNVIGTSDFGFFDFLHGLTFAFSIIGLVMGFVFLNHSRSRQL